MIRSSPHPHKKTNPQSQGQDPATTKLSLWCDQIKEQTHVYTRVGESVLLLNIMFPAEDKEEELHPQPPPLNSYSPQKNNTM